MTEAFIGAILGTCFALSMYRLFFDNNKDIAKIQEKIEELENKFEYPYSENDNSRFQEWVDWRSEYINGSVKTGLRSLAKQLGYEQPTEKIEWVKIKKK